MTVSTSNLVSARVPSQIYNKLAQAAELSGSTLNQFILQAAIEKALSVIANDRAIAMTLESATLLFAAIEKPPVPSRKLRQAVMTHKRVLCEKALK